MKKYILLFFGIVFGFILSRAGATTYDYYAQLFLFQDLQLLWVIVTAGAVGVVGVYFFKAIKARSLFEKQPIDFQGKSYIKTLMPGSLIFGLGWGLAGACPGTVLAMLGEGKLGAIFTIAGVLLGTYLYGVQQTWMEKSRQAKEAAGVTLSKNS